MRCMKITRMTHRLALNLKSIRKDRWRMSQDRFAQLFDSSRSKINSYENGGVEPSIAFILKLQELTNITVRDLFYNTVEIDEVPPFPLEKGQSFVRDSESQSEDISKMEQILQLQKQTLDILNKLDNT